VAVSAHRDEELCLFALLELRDEGAPPSSGAFGSSTGVPMAAGGDGNSSVSGRDTDEENTSTAFDIRSNFFSFP